MIKIAIGDAITQILYIFNKYWYLFAIAFLVGFVVVLIMKLYKEKRKTWDEVKRHHKELSMEEKYNKSWYQWVYSGNDLKGKLISIKLKNHSEFDKKRNEFGKVIKSKEPTKSLDFAIIRMKVGKFGLGKNFSLWFKTESYCFPYELISHNNENKSIHVSPEINIDKYKGYMIPSNFENMFTRKFIDSEFSKQQMDYQVNANANQLIRFSSIHHEFGHDIRKLEKEAETERAKKERKRVG